MPIEINLRNLLKDSAFIKKRVASNEFHKSAHSFEWYIRDRNTPVGWMKSAMLSRNRTITKDGLCFSAGIQTKLWSSNAWNTVMIWGVMQPTNHINWYIVTRHLLLFEYFFFNSTPMMLTFVFFAILFQLLLSFYLLIFLLSFMNKNLK